MGFEFTCKNINISAALRCSSRLSHEALDTEFGYCSHEVSKKKKNHSTETIWWEENQSLVELLTTHAHTESIICDEGSQTDSASF